MEAACNMLCCSGAEAVRALLAPDWAQLTRPRVWAEAVVQVVASLQLGLGLLPSLAAHNLTYLQLLRRLAITCDEFILFVRETRYSPDMAQVT